MARRTVAPIEEAWREKSAPAAVIPPDDAAIQLSPGIRGITADPDRTLTELHERYAERYIPEESHRLARSDGQVWQAFAQRLALRADLLHRIVPYTLRSRRPGGYQYEFENAWKNGKWNVAQPVSLDLVDPRAIREKATQWTGRVVEDRLGRANVLLARGDLARGQDDLAAALPAYLEALKLYEAIDDSVGRSNGGRGGGCSRGTGEGAGAQGGPSGSGESRAGRTARGPRQGRS